MNHHRKHLKNFGYGCLTWLIPFIASVPFYTKEGVLLVDMFLFKTVMILVGSVTAASLLTLYLKKIDTGYLKEGVVVGWSWFVINIVLDLSILIPMSKMTYGDYFIRIGLRYLAIPVMSIMAGILLQEKSFRDETENGVASF